MKDYHIGELNEEDKTNQEKVAKKWGDDSSPDNPR